MKLEKKRGGGHLYHQPDKKSRVRRFRRPTDLFSLLFSILKNACTQSWNWRGNGQNTGNKRPTGEGQVRCSFLNAYKQIIKTHQNEKQLLKEFLFFVVHLRTLVEKAIRIHRVTHV